MIESSCRTYSLIDIYIHSTLRPTAVLDMFLTSKQHLADKSGLPYDVFVITRQVIAVREKLLSCDCIDFIPNQGSQKRSLSSDNKSDT